MIILRNRLVLEVLARVKAQLKLPLLNKIQATGIKFIKYGALKWTLLLCSKTSWQTDQPNKRI